MKIKNWHTKVDNVVEFILNTRDVCGNEAMAMDEALRDNSLPADKDIIDLIHYRVQTKWRLAQKAAGIPRKYWRIG